MKLPATVQSCDRASRPSDGLHVWRVIVLLDKPAALAGGGGAPITQAAFYLRRDDDPAPLSYGDRVDVPWYLGNAHVPVHDGRVLRMLGYVFDPDHEPGLG